MNNHSESGTRPENPAIQQWGLNRDITPCFGARLVQEGNRLHYLADRAGFNGAFSDEDALSLDQAFPLILKQLELMLISGELNLRYQHCVTLYHNGLTCEADTLGSCGYVYIAIYPEQTEPQ
ncbi:MULTISPECIES: type IV toxin-antitoxin system YeeU family antitoxin [Enterobacteriaceae]|uniref:type IV toxin-antitoxin system YeeU family antitoxin n=1 Tax=Enterobacteriaceae TaxID=543 RepID=UPI000C7E030F|nr:MULTISPECIES: type IV toxin-antitoxin system YeeU family antitoxin [Klebsiella/Raoultella group]NRF55835.1 type IV toxin-antitoxin system YeeU family antitoxin [Citrobacter braakii]EKZ6358692.1 type IV toxin-antitoxin system YeeU family antitoxin [Klebsiella aerogenes]MBE0094432.1 type IV toxin-antitoxin system YeeU family antitoxin [Raoultella planticola]HDU3679414.1 type IV toxin-antitoxin system YeeU family antitoxin [Klebsiella aerogenes]HDU3699670.1 type IV toxin-antitoxin system YeeU 